MNAYHHLQELVSERRRLKTPYSERLKTGEGRQNHCDWEEKDYKITKKVGEHHSSFPIWKENQLRIF